MLHFGCGLGCELLKLCYGFLHEIMAVSWREVSLKRLFDGFGFYISLGGDKTRGTYVADFKSAEKKRHFAAYFASFLVRPDAAFLKMTLKRPS